VTPTEFPELPIPWTPEEFADRTSIKFMGFVPLGAFSRSEEWRKLSDELGRYRDSRKTYKRLASGSVEPEQGQRPDDEMVDA
jgi:hypothetical protein